MKQKQLDDALIDAVESGSADEVRRLLAEKANPNAVNVYDDMVLTLAADYGNHDIVRMILDAGAEVNAKNVYGKTALMVIAESIVSDESRRQMESMVGSHVRPSATPDTIRMLLDAGANPNAATDEGYTALMGAACRGNFQVVKLLLDAGANPNAKTSDGTTVLMLAKREGTPMALALTAHVPSDEIVPILQEKGAK